MQPMSRPAQISERRFALVATVGLFITVCLAACAGAAPPSTEHEEPALVEPIDGSDGLHRITLTERAAERLGIEVTKAESMPSGRQDVRIPYSSVIYDADGAAWAYVLVEEPLVFERTAITVKDVISDSTGGHALLSAGLEPGTPVVAVGVAELFGTESSVGH